MTSRWVFAGIFLVCAALLAVAFYMEHVMGLEPCPLCIVQRIALIVVGLICLAAVLHNPGPKNGKRTGARTYGVLLTLASYIIATARAEARLRAEDELET